MTGSDLIMVLSAGVYLSVVANVKEKECKFNAVISKVWRDFTYMVKAILSPGGISSTRFGKMAFVTVFLFDWLWTRLYDHVPYAPPTDLIAIVAGIFGVSLYQKYLEGKYYDRLNDPTPHINKELETDTSDPCDTSNSNMGDELDQQQE